MMAKPAEHAMETLLEEAKLSEEVWEVLLDAPREEREKPLPKKASSGGVGEWLREVVGSRESKGVGGSTPRTGKAREGAKVEEEEDAQLAAAIQPSVMSCAHSPTARVTQEAAIAQLGAMGFGREASLNALRRANYDISAATNLLLG
ncbi:MAG: hypothetical protein SGPRY_007404 [Prymnesium sp.]